MSTALAAGMIVAAGFQPVHAEEINILASGSFKGALVSIIPAWEKKTGNKINVSWGPSMGTSPQSLPQRIKNNQKMDAAIIADEALNVGKISDYFDLSTLTKLAASPIGLAVPASTKNVPEIKTRDELITALLNAKKVAISQGASGVYVKDVLFKKLNINDQMKKRMIIIEGSELVGDALARNEADIGIQQVSELRFTKGIKFISPLPDDLQKKSNFSFIISKKTDKRALVTNFINYLHTPKSIAEINASGLESF